MKTSNKTPQDEDCMLNLGSVKCWCLDLESFDPPCGLISSCVHSRAK